jgi:outer membrane lipoprotein-sorting protein
MKDGRLVARNWKRWIPAVSAPVVVAAVVMGGVFAASASADPAPKTPQQVLELVGSSKVTAFSGTIEQSSNLGLPDLSGVGPTGSGSSSGSADSSATDALELLTGSHTARVYVDGDKARVQVLDKLAERDAIRNGNEVWLYDSSDSSAVHSTLPEHSSTDATPAPGGAQTPAQLAEKLLAAVDPTTDVTVGDPVKVAGRSAYDLVLTPRSDTTLVGSASIAVDSETGLPLSVTIDARGQSDPAISVAFSSFSLDTPSADLFDFTPPKGTDVTEKAFPTAPPADHSADGSTHPEPTVTGTGWDSVVELSVGDTSSLTSSPLFAQLTTPVDGGSIIQTSLVTVLITSDGRVLAGAVPADTLEAAAAQ